MPRRRGPESVHPDTRLKPYGMTLMLTQSHSYPWRVTPVSFPSLLYLSLTPKKSVERRWMMFTRVGTCQGVSNSASAPAWISFYARCRVAIDGREHSAMLHRCIS